LFSRIPLLVATGFYLGRFPYAPGTVGSLAGFLLFLPFRHLPWTIHLLIAGVLFAVGTYAAGMAERELARRDPSAVIIDEIAGCWVAVLAIPPYHLPLLSAVALFRVFDIWKPFPADRAQRLPGGWGVMLDDLVAGVYANLCVRLFGWWLPGVTG
jgi:phosphatidylglycerophosphatase A